MRRDVEQARVGRGRGGRLAAQLRVKLEFVEVKRTPPTPAMELDAGRVDIIMSGMTATVSRAERMELSDPYSKEHAGFVVRDHDRGRFETVDAINADENIVVAVPPVEGALDEFKRLIDEELKGG